MAYAEPYVYLRALGSFGATATSNVEEWGVGLKFRNPGTTPSAANLQAFANKAVTRFTTFHTGSWLAGTHVWLKEITAALIGLDGKYVGGSAQDTTRAVLGTPVAGTGTTNAPYTQALVVSLRTVLSRGPGSNGRMYYPSTSNPIDPATGQLNSAARAQFVAAAKVLIDGLNLDADAELPGTGGLAVMSQKPPGVAATVTSIRVGGRYDRQERREKSIEEAYTALSITPVSTFVARDLTRPIGT